MTKTISVRAYIWLESPKGNKNVLFNILNNIKNRLRYIKNILINATVEKYILRRVMVEWFRPL